MASDHIQLTVEPRADFGSAATRRLRKTGLVPGILYQKGEASLPFQLPEHDLRKLLRSEGVRTSVVDVIVGSGKSHPALFRDWQIDPVRGAILHVDMAEVDLTATIQADVAIVLVGTPVGVREGGVLDQPVHALTVEALPDSLPDQIELDVSELEVGSTLHVSDLSVPDGVRIVDDLELVVASVTHASAVEVDEEVEEDAEPEIVGQKESAE
jgi:large subunit ribosomal protein L25